MQIPVVNQCCCGIDLKTAGRILGGLTVVSALLAILIGDRIVPHLIVLALGCAWLYGVEREKTSFMLPTIIIESIGLALMLLVALYLILFGKKTEIIRIEGDKIEEEEINPIILGVAIILSAIPGAYFLIVEYSLYRHIKDNQNTIPMHNTPPKNEV